MTTNKPPPKQPKQPKQPHHQAPQTVSGPNGKYLLIDVPNFNAASDPSEEMRSYIRLGMVDPNVAGNKVRADWGEDLAVKAKKPTRLDGVTTGAADDAKRSLPYSDQEIVFEDDVRKRDPKDGSWSIARRLQESEKLHTKGGWRDHSDGNRITTTRGDKVEVIRGNYKLVVIGRQNKATTDDDDDLAGIASGFDISGGEVRGMGMNLGEFETTSVEWVEDDNGRYRFVEKNQKGDTYSIYWGDTHEEFFGEWKVDVTGSEDPSTYPPVVPGTTAPSKVNPKIVSKTWAASIEEYTGSAKKRVPTIKSETWAEKVDEVTDILHGTTSNTRIGGGTAEATTIGAGTVSATTIGGGTAESTVVGLGMADMTIVGLGTASMTIVGLGTAELTIAGVGSSSLSIVPQASEISIGNALGVSIGDKVDVSVGNAISATTGQVNEVYLGVKNSLSIASLVEIFVGFKASFQWGPYIDTKTEDMEIKLTTGTKLGSSLKKLGFKIDEG